MSSYATLGQYSGGITPEQQDQLARQSQQAQVQGQNSLMQRQAVQFTPEQQLQQQQLGIQPLNPATAQQLQADPAGYFGQLSQNAESMLAAQQQQPAGPSAAQQQLAGTVYNAQRAQIASGRGVRGVAPGISQALAARNATTVGGLGNIEMGMLQAREAGLDAQLQALSGLEEQRRLLEEYRIEQERRAMEEASQKSLLGSIISGGLGVGGLLVGGLASGGNPLAMAAGYQGGRTLGNAAEYYL